MNANLNNKNIGYSNGGRMKIMHFIHSLIGGGAEKQLRLLSQNLNVYNIDSSIFCVDKSGVFDLFPVDILQGPSLAKSPWLAFRAIQKSIKECDPDIVHCWLPASITIPAMLAAKMNRRICIFSYRNKMYFHRPLAVVEFLVALFCSDKVVSNHYPEDSNFLYRWLYRIKGGVVIPNAVFIGSQRRRKGGSEKKPSDPLKFIFVGRFTDQKNPLLLLNALAALPKTLNWCLSMYGQGELEQNIKNCVALLGLADRVKIEGFVSDVYDKMLISDLLLFPSKKEGMPNVLVEALALGLPIVASSIPANRRILGKGDNIVYWCNPEDVGSITNAVGLYLKENQDDISRRVSVGAEVARKYSLDKMVGSYSAVYSEQVKSREI